MKPHLLLSGQEGQEAIEVVLEVVEDQEDHMLVMVRLGVWALTCCVVSADLQGKMNQSTAPIMLGAAISSRNETKLTS